MPANQSADGLRRAPRVRAVIQAARFTPAQKLLLLGLNAWPCFHLLAAVGWLSVLPASLPIRATIALAWLLLVPPALCRLIVRGGLPVGECEVPSRTFFRWWATWQFQMCFNRLPWIEETLRFLPAVYSMWLRLWGAKIGRLTLWSPGVRVFDRPLARIGDDVVLGLDARLVGHFGGLDAAGRVTLTLGPILLGDRTTLGGGALLGPGVVLEADQVTETLFLGAPFTHWQAGERVRSVSSLSSVNLPNT